MVICTICKNEQYLGPIACGACMPCVGKAIRYYEEHFGKTNLGKNKLNQEKVNHPMHYGGIDNSYEAIKVIDAWNANFNLGNAIKYICRASLRKITDIGIGAENSVGANKYHKEKYLEDLNKARTYIDFEISKVEKIK
jgi:hypothetical protein